MVNNLIFRRRQMLSGKDIVDTSPVILAENSAWDIGGTIRTLQDTSATIIYRYEASTSARKLVYSNIYYRLIIFEDDVYMDYWSAMNSGDTRNVLNANSNGIGFTIPTNKIDDAYAFIPSTGQILFAGRNTPYYGYTNINEM